MLDILSSQDVDRPARKAVKSLKEYTDKLLEGRYKIDHCDNVRTVKQNPGSTFPYTLAITGGTVIRFAIKGSNMLGVYSYHCPAHNVAFTDTRSFALVNSDRLNGKPMLHPKPPKPPRISRDVLKRFSVNTRSILLLCMEFDAAHRGDDLEKLKGWDRIRAEKKAEEQAKLDEYLGRNKPAVFKTENKPKIKGLL